MNMVPPAYFLCALSSFLAVWVLNLYLIRSGKITRAFRSYTTHIGTSELEGDIDVEDTAPGLAMAYEAIYGPAEERFESENARTILLLFLALLLNVVCIQIELILFQDMMEH